MRTAKEAIVRSEDDDRIFFNTRFLYRLTDHTHGCVHSVDHLVVDCHNFVVLVAVAPTDKAFVLPTLFALPRKVLSVLTAIVSRFGEGFSCI